MTNFEKIKNMSVKEMAYFIDDITMHCVNEDCKNCPIGNAKNCSISEIEAWLNKEI